MAHELVHCFGDFLTGDKAILTPIHIVPADYVQPGPKPRGESGWEWELQALGGLGDLSAPQNKGHFPRAQLWLTKNNKDLRVDSKAIMSIVEGGGKAVPEEGNVLACLD